MELFVITVLALTLSAGLAIGSVLMVRTVTNRALEVQSGAIQVYREVVLAQASRIESVENRLMSHNWTEYAQLQNTVAGETQQAAALWPTPERSEHGWGENPQEVFEAAMAGVDMEGPTVG